MTITDNGKITVFLLDLSFHDSMYHQAVTMKTLKQNEDPYARGLIKIASNKVKSQSRYPQ